MIQPELEKDIIECLTLQSWDLFPVILFYHFKFLSLIMIASFLSHANSSRTLQLEYNIYYEYFRVSLKHTLTFHIRLFILGNVNFKEELM